MGASCGAAYLRASRLDSCAAADFPHRNHARNAGPPFRSPLPLRHMPAPAIKSPGCTAIASRIPATHMAHRPRPARSAACDLRESSAPAAPSRSRPYRPLRACTRRGWHSSLSPDMRHGAYKAAIEDPARQLCPTFVSRACRIACRFGRGGDLVQAKLRASLRSRRRCSPKFPLDS